MSTISWILVIFCILTILIAAFKVLLDIQKDLISETYSEVLEKLEKLLIKLDKIERRLNENGRS